MGGTGIFSHPDTSLLLSGTLSSSGGATFLGDMFVNDSNVSGTLTVGTSTVIITSTNISATAGMTLGGAAVFTNNQNANPNSIITSGSISSSLGSLIIGGGTTLSNTVNISGTTTTAGTISSSAGAVFLGTVIADTIQASSSIMSAGSFTISGTISSSGEGAFHSLKSQDGATITGSTTLHGALSSSYGGTYLGGIIATTLEASSSIMSAGNLTVTGTISGSGEGAFHSLKSQAGTTLTGSLVNHGALTVTNGTISSSGPMVIGGIAVFSNAGGTTAPSLSISGTVLSAGQISSSAGAIFADTVVLTKGGTTIQSSGSTILGNLPQRVHQITGTLNVSGAGVTAPALYATGTNGGKVGIKTNSPTSTLSVSGNIGVSSSTNTTYINFTETDGTNGIGIRVTAGTMQFKNIGGSWTAMGSGGGVGLSDDNAWTGKNAFSGSGFQALPTAHFTNTATAISTSGSVGIKTSSPTSLLSVSGNIGLSSSANTTYINFTETDGSDGIGIRVTAGTMQFRNVGGSWAAISSGGSGTSDSDDIVWTGTQAFSGSSFQVLPTAHFTNTGTSIQVSGNILPGTDNSSDLGSAAKRWANLYTGDLHLKNDRGDWTIIEEEDYLSLRNNKTGKLFKFVLQEIE